MRRRLALTPLLTAALAASPAAAAQGLESSVASGPVEATVRLTPAEPVIGDVLRLELEVRAEPGVELLMPEFGEALGRFSVLDFAPQESLAEDGATVARQHYRLQPMRSGPQSVPPLLIEFVDRRPGRPPAPEGGDAYELLTERLDFEVAAVLPQDAPLELRPAKDRLPPQRPAGPGLWPWLLAAGAAVAAAAALAARAWLAHRARRRRRSAYEVARAELDGLLYGPRPDASTMDAFFVRLSGIVRRYLEDRFGLRSPELTTEEFLEALADSPELVRGHRRLLQTFLQRADRVKFACEVPAPSEVEESIEAARRFLDQTREEAGPAARAPAGSPRPAREASESAEAPRA